MTFTPPQAGVEIIEGLGGSGKSYFAVRRAVLSALADGRVVYTNLPLRWRVVRQYMRVKSGREEYANLFRDLTPEHFDRFIKRFAQWARFKDKLRAMHDGIPVKEIRKRFHDQFGLNVTQGDDANWCVEGSIVILDEAHFWYPMSDQKNEPRELLEMLSLHRHGHWWLWFITQERVRISKTIRTQCTKLWQVRNMGEDSIVGPLKWRHLGFRGQGYVAYTGDQVEGRAGRQTDPIDNYAIWTMFPWNQWVFRLYDSFMHVGSVRDMERNMDLAREEAGITDDQPSRTTRMPARKRLGRFVFRLVFRAVRFAVFAMLIAAIAYSVGASRARPDTADEADQTDIDVGQLGSIGPDFVRVSGERVPLGSSSVLGTLLYSDPRAGVTLWRRGDHVWVWRRRSQPQRVATLDRFQDVLHTAAATDVPIGRLPAPEGATGNRGPARPR